MPGLGRKFKKTSQFKTIAKSSSINNEAFYQKHKTNNSQWTKYCFVLTALIINKIHFTQQNF